MNSCFLKYVQYNTGPEKRSKECSMANKCGNAAATLVPPWESIRSQEILQGAIPFPVLLTSFPERLSLHRLSPRPGYLLPSDLNSGITSTVSPS